VRYQYEMEDCRARAQLSTLHYAERTAAHRTLQQPTGFYMSPNIHYTIFTYDWFYAISTELPASDMLLLPCSAEISIDISRTLI
jgi:hypothetical protein